MASNRYGQIWHGKHHHLNIRFPSVDARKAYAEKFQNYHALHDHEGEAPRFELVSASAIPNWERTDDVDRLTIDGYSWNDIKSYHTEDYLTSRSRYCVPTCCVPPIIVLDSDFVDSGTLQRHELSSVFGDMPDADYASLLESVKRDGFMDPLIRVLDGKVLDGWHRYRAARELNLIRKLKFTKWDEDKEGDATAFVLARNIERRHLSASQRAQIAVAFNERFGHGGDRSKTPNGVLKTKKELAEQAKVGTSTIDRALAVEKAGQSEAVIAGEKTASQVISETKTPEDQLVSLRQQITAEMLTWKQGFKIADTITFAMLVETRFEFKHRVLRGKSPFYNEELTALLKLLQTRDVSFVDFVRAKYPETLQVEAESSETETASEVIPEETLNSLWEQINAAIPAWKKKREGVGYASKGMFIHATLKFLGLTHDSETNSDVLEKLLHLLTGKRTNILEVLIKRQLRGESLWSADDAAEVAKPPEDKSAETSDNREVSKLLKKKKKRFKSIWDLRKQAAADYVGKGDTDLNRFLTLPELENGFARNHKFMADAFRSGMERISLATFHACEERTLASGVSLEDLNKEHQAIQTYAYDILIWQREEWIQQLIAQKKSVQADTELVSEVESETETDAPLPDESETAGLIEIVTEPEPESIASVPDPDGCRKVLQRTLSNQGMLNKSNVDARHLSEIYNISRGDVMRLKEEVWTQGLAKTIEKHKSVREVACMKWYGWPDLSDATTWDQVCDAACNQFAFLSKETFDGSREKPGFDDYKQLQREINQLEHFNLCLSEQAGWIQALIPETETESPPAEEREFQYAILTGVTLWYKERSPVPGGKAVETSTYVEFGDAIGNEDMGTGPENPLEALPLEVRQGLQKALEDV